MGENPKQLISPKSQDWSRVLQLPVHSLLLTSQQRCSRNCFWQDIPYRISEDSLDPVKSTKPLQNHLPQSPASSGMSILQHSRFLRQLSGKDLNQTDKNIIHPSNTTVTSDRHERGTPLEYVTVLPNLSKTSSVQCLRVILGDGIISNVGLLPIAKLHWKTSKIM